MNPDLVLRLLREGMLLILVLSAGPMLAAMIVGLFVSILQATTQIQEQTLTYVPKLLAIFLALAIAGPWMLRQTIAFAAAMLNAVATVK